MLISEPLINFSEALISAPLIKWIVNLNFFLTLFYQDGDPPVSLALKRTLEVARFVWVLECVTKKLFQLSLQVRFLCVVALISLF